MSGHGEVRGPRLQLWLVPIGLFALAAAVRLAAAVQLPFPTAEPSAYYVGVAENALAGYGFVSDGVWSYATEPLVVPKPAFELWLPMSTFISMIAMALLGSTYWAAQVGGALAGALVAPLAWAVAREAAHTHGLDERRSTAVAIAAGLLTAVLGPFVLASVVPDSATPFTVFVLVSALLVPRLLGLRDGREADPPRDPSWLAGLALGLAMGLAYLSRQEVIWVGLAVLLLAWWVLRGHTPGARIREAIVRLGPVVMGGLFVVIPWLLRNWRDLDSPFPGQAVENMFLIDNEDIFAFLERPSASTYLGQGLETVLTNPLVAAWDNFVNVIAIPAFPIGLAGLVALIGLRRSPALRRPTALLVLLISGGLTYLTTVLLFPVATLWGTFLHASGPLIVALTVLAALGGDALLARISSFRRWDRPNVILAPVALLAVTVALTAFGVSIFSEQSVGTEARYTDLGRAIEASAEEVGQDVPPTIITDHPMWLADVMDRSAIALPDEDLSSLAALSRHFGAPWVAVLSERGRYPRALLADDARACLTHDPLQLAGEPAPAWLFVLAPECGDV